MTHTVGTGQRGPAPSLLVSCSWSQQGTWWGWSAQTRPGREAAAAGPAADDLPPALPAVGEGTAAVPLGTYGHSTTEEEKGIM